MTYTARRIDRHALTLRRWTQVLTLFLLAGLGLVPLGCRPSSADAKKEDANAAEAESGSAEKTSYEVPAYTGPRTVAQRLNDASLAAQIKQALVHQRALRIFDFEPEVVGPTVTLRGDVNTKAQWVQVERVAARVADGRTVVNEVTIGGRPVEEGEDEGAGHRGQVATTSAAAYHTVERGESLWQIARQYGASVQRLRTLNDLASDDLRVGQRLRVR